MVGSFFPAAIFSVLLIIQVVLIIGLVAGFVFATAIWRISVTHRELADSLKEIAGSLKNNSPNSL